MTYNDLYNRYDNKNGKIMKGTLVCLVKSARVNARISSYIEAYSNIQMEISADKKTSS